MRFLGVVVFLTCVAVVCYADGPVAAPLTAADQARLARYEAARQAAGYVGGGPYAVGQLVPGPLRLKGVEIRGRYRCRTMRFGGGGIHPGAWDDCRIDRDDIGYRLAGGGAGTSFGGHFIGDTASRLIYYGVWWKPGEAVPRYGGRSDRTQAGYFYRFPEGWYRLDIPWPTEASPMLVLEVAPPWTGR
jgi:Domain of unknown function (DUF4893)